MLKLPIIKRILQAVRRLKYTPRPHRKKFFKLSYDMLRWIYKNRGGINLFVDYGLVEKNSRIGDFLTERAFKKSEKKLNDHYYLPLLEDKMIFYQYLKEIGFPVPNNRFIVINNSLLVPGSAKRMPIDKIYEYEVDGYMKIINGFAGKNVYKIIVRAGKLFINHDEWDINAFKSLTEKNIFLIQDRVIQHSEINRINPSCINTLRIVTVNSQNEPSLFHVSQRFGINGNHVDNNSMGNIAVGVNMDSGRLMEKAYTHDPAHFKIKTHPDTGVTFEDYQVPFYKEAINMTLELHQYFTHFSIIGWDIAITPNGPSIIEGNYNTNLTMSEVGYGGYKKHPLIKEMLETTI